VNSSVVIPGPGIVITDISVRIEKISHPSTSDLQITLIAPNNQTVTLISSGVAGGSNMDFIHTIFLDSAPTQINGMNPFTGNFRPDSPLSPLNGSGSGGTWKLHIIDTIPLDTGTLEAWGLEVCGSVAAPTHYVYLPLILR
jgi:subtilisin-like proprotein convertase family protein